ncbi:hypothetical protein [Kribbella sp. CA-294648]|uniref:hypothetical protein n=1 Tax=Kribbella sp. CA-294648 TaxID=3239948 RepID=UPI003D8DC56D
MEKNSSYVEPADADARSRGATRSTGPRQPGAEAAATMKRAFSDPFRGWLSGSQTEIANILNLALGTVKSRTDRARRRLADLLTHLGDPHYEPTF